MGQFASLTKRKHNEEEEKTLPVRAKKDYLSKYAELLKEKGILPDMFLVHDKQSSEFVDEDGNEAHEFYTEQIDGTRRWLCRTMDNLRPKGKERYQIPRLSPDLPVVIWEIQNQER